jgi:hypothetical protein
VIFATPDDVHALQGDLEAQAHDITNALAACIQAGTITVRATVFQHWKAMAKRIRRFLNEEPTWIGANSQMERGHAIQRDMQPIYDEVNAAGCKAPAKPSAPAKDPGLGDMLSGYGWLVALALGAMILHEARNV